MRKTYLFALLCFALFSQGAWAQENTVAFNETFDTNETNGGRDGDFGKNVGSGAVHYVNDGWTGNSSNKIYSAFKCIRFGTGSDNGVCTTPAVSLTNTTHALLTFSAAGWYGSTKNNLTITANDGVTISGDTNIELVNEEWNDYSVLITLTTAENIQITFTGKRGFLDDVVVRNINTVPAPTLEDDCQFWPHTTETKATKTITLTPLNYAPIRYTTDGTTPSTNSGILATETTNINIEGTTTINAIAFVGDITSSVTTRTYSQGETVNSISAFKAKNDNDEVRLFIADNANARVLHGTDGKMYLRDNTGTLCMDFGTTATFNPTPAHNQHVAGWIVGKKQTINGLPKLLATDNTRTNYLALAAPVTEAATTPVAIATNEIGDHVGEWVTMENVRNSNTIAVTGIYDNALVDVSGIITANNTISPVDYNDIEPIVYVIDEDENFVSPNSNIVNATLRLKRTLKAGIWNTFTIPMDLPIASNIAGKYRSYTDVNGDVLIFSEASSIEAGKPYLVKPDVDIANPVFTGTLSATPAQNVEQTGSNIAFKGIYSPTELKTDKTEQFLTASGKLGYPSSSSTATLKGMRAYFYVPAGTEARVFIEGEDITGIEQIDNIKLAVENYYNLNGQRISKPTKGLYIVNGKKVVIK